MDKQSALEKIKKCLALGKSANEHEAAQALKHAQVLMTQFGLDELDISLSEISEDRISAPLIVPQWHWNLVHLCGLAFGCERWHNVNSSGGGFIFCGVNGRPELAAYAYTVLLRHLKATRRKYIKTELSRVRISKNKTARADKFCAGWVRGVRQNVMNFAQQSEQEIELIIQYRNRKYGEMKEAKTRDIKGVRDYRNDYRAGCEIGKDVKLNVPLAQSEKKTFILKHFHHESSCPA